MPLLHLLFLRVPLCFSVISVSLFLFRAEAQVIDGNAESDGDVERRLAAGHRQAEDAVAQGQESGVNAGAFVADDEGQWAERRLGFV